MTRWRALVSASIWVLLCLSLWVTGSRPAVIALAGIVAVGASVVVSIIDVSKDIGETGWPPARTNNRVREGDQWVMQLRFQMAGARQTVSTELRDRLVALVDDRLIINHNIHRTEQPMIASQALTPTLRDLLTGSPRRLGSRRVLERTLTDIEMM